jgi:tetratricopeptide (TPR) repeat protein
LGLPLAARAGAEDTRDPAAALSQALSAAESRLAAGDLEAAERHYHDALFEGWLLLGTLDRLESRTEEARRAFSRASTFVPDDLRAALALASAQLQVGDAAEAVAVLEPRRGERPDLETTRVLARAQASAGKQEEALRTLEAGVAAAPDDPEVAFVIANEYLWLKKVAAADRLFATVLERRPLPSTHVLIGRAYRDAGEYDRARRELRRAIELDPKARRAHYYLGTVAPLDPTAGPDGLGTAIAEFREELRLTGEDPLVLDQLGTTLVEAGRPEEAARVLERAVRAEDRAQYVYDLGHAQLAQGQPAEAAVSLRRALRLCEEQGGGEAELEKIHYQLGKALQRLGNSQEALAHLREARRIAARWTDPTRRVTTVGPPGVAG